MAAQVHVRRCLLVVRHRPAASPYDETPRDALLYFSFEDERLAEMGASELHWVIEEYYSLHPEHRDARAVTLFLDEIQVVPGWEVFARRLLDQERVELFLSGSSARILSREVATSMRGRAMGILVRPFSLRESLRHRGAEPGRPWSDLPEARRSAAVARHSPLSCALRSRWERNAGLAG
jgi:predicted AAA+ superfamily ATPase